MWQKDRQSSPVISVARENLDVKFPVLGLESVFFALPTPRILAMFQFSEKKDLGASRSEGLSKTCA